MSTKIRFKAKEGIKASFYDSDDDCYRDCTLKRVSRRENVALVIADNTKEQFRVPLSMLEPPIYPDINQRFDFFEQLVGLAATKKIKALFVTGKGGIGKSFTTDNALEAEELEEETDFVRIKGHCTSYALYHTLEEYSDRIVLFDDCDDILRDQLSLNILKTVLDTQGVRRVKWITKNDTKKSFVFEGTVIFLSNMAKEKVEQAIISRSVVIDLFMTSNEIIERMNNIIQAIPITVDLEDEERVTVLRMLDKYKNSIMDLNIRTLIKALEVFGNSRNMALTRYQILNG